jgi:predicted ATPase/DNA-binding CsgD family transcriptional regulator
MQEKLIVFPAQPSSGSRRNLPKHNLPTSLTPLIGREQAVMEVCALLRQPEIRLLTLTGTGGVGKTRLGLEIATNLLDDFADGVCFVSLASVSYADLVLPTIASELGLRNTGGWPLFEQLSTTLREQHLLLVLDNFEQVVAAASALVAVLQTCPGLKMLVTSRATLHVRGEYEVRVTPLALPDPQCLDDDEALSQSAAVALFLERAAALAPGFHVTSANMRAVAEICVRLDGLPLAIELAAARSKLLPPQALLARLERRLAVLTRAAQDLPERQQTLRKALAWSYDLLTGQEQRLFRLLSAFVGGCTLQAASAVASLGGNADSQQAMEVLDGVASLVDKSLVQQTQQEGEEPRLLLLETVREYGQECLMASSEALSIPRAHAHYYLALAELAQQHLIGAQQGKWLDQLEQEQDNLRVAWQWFLDHQEQELACRLGAALWRFWWMRGYLSEGRSVLEQMVTMSEGIAVSVRARVLNAAGVLAGMQGDYRRAETLCGESLKLFKEQQEPHGMVISLWMLGYVPMMEGNYVLARELEEEALSLSRQIDDRWGIATSLRMLASLTYEEGNSLLACSLGEASVATSRLAGDNWTVGEALGITALALLTQGHLEHAQHSLEECLTLCRELGNKRSVAYALSLLGLTAYLQSMYTRGHLLCEEGLRLSREVGDRRAMVFNLYGLSVIALGQSEYVAAQTCFEACLELLLALSYTHKSFLALSLEGLAYTALAQGKPVWATRLLGAAELVREEGPALPAITRKRYGQAVADARQQLGEETFHGAWTEGRSMTLKQVLVARRPVRTPFPAEVSAPAPAKSPLASPAGLTAREVEVLRLVARGLTNPQIAEKLVISPQTVHAHLRSIYSKVGVTTRSAATRFAVEHHII